jgi:phosphoserine phosphatase
MTPNELVRNVIRPIRLVIFDLDGTLTQIDSLWRHLHEAFGTWENGKRIAERYWRGEISYTEWAETDARCWAGTPLSKINAILDGIEYTIGAKEVFAELRRKSVKTAILSAGLTILANKALRDLSADLAIANELRANDGHLTGEITVKVAVNNKAVFIEQIASRFGVPLREVALVGDRNFDLSKPECLKIAYKPKDDLAKRNADAIVVDDDLRTILQYLI